MDTCVASVSPKTFISCNRRGMTSFFCGWRPLCWPLPGRAAAVVPREADAFMFMETMASLLPTSAALASLSYSPSEASSSRTGLCSPLRRLRCCWCEKEGERSSFDTMIGAGAGALAASGAAPVPVVPPTTGERAGGDAAPVLPWTLATKLRSRNATVPSNPLSGTSAGCARKDSAV